MRTMQRQLAAETDFERPIATGERQIRFIWVYGDSNGEQLNQLGRGFRSVNPPQAEVVQNGRGSFRLTMSQ